MEYYLRDLKDLLGDKIVEVVKKGDITPNELECMDTAVDIIKDIETIEAMRDYGEDEYSSRAMRGYNRSRDPYYYDMEGSYDRGRNGNMSYRGRGGNGGSGYSRHGGEMVQKLEALMQEASTDEERHALTEMIDRLQKR